MPGTFTGTALYAGGDFTTAGGVEVNRVARWDGTAWSGLSGPLATGVDGLGVAEITSLAGVSHGPVATLYAGGNFSSAGGHRSSHIAAWRCVRDLIFADGFETRDTAVWKATLPSR